MPIYMDRHNVPGVSARDVAEVHQEDIKVQDKYNCKVMTYWFDEEKGIAFCLIEAPDKKAVKEMHENAHGLVPNQIIEVESNIVEVFLGRIEDPKPSGITDDSDLFVFQDPAFRTVIVIELKKTALISSKIKTTENNRFFRVYNKIIQEALEQYNGREVRCIDGSFMASFTSVSKSMECAVEIQIQLKKYNSRNSDVRFDVAMGLNAGNPVTGNDGFFGEVIQLAKRLSYIADGGRIMASSAVADHFKREGAGTLPESSILKVLNPMEEEFLNRLMAALEKSWNQESISVGNLCKQIGLSKSQLYRKLTALTDCAPTDLMKKFRLEKAIGLLEKQQNNISQVAFATGFSSPSYFTKCFKKQFDILPSDYLDFIS